MVCLKLGFVELYSLAFGRARTSDQITKGIATRQGRITDVSEI